jgi:hypothetical protein
MEQGLIPVIQADDGRRKYVAVIRIRETRLLDQRLVSREPAVRDGGIHHPAMSIQFLLVVVRSLTLERPVPRFGKKMGPVSPESPGPGKADHKIPDGVGSRTQASYAAPNVAMNDQ